MTGDMRSFRGLEVEGVPGKGKTTTFASGHPCRWTLHAPSRHSTAGVLVKCHLLLEGLGSIYLLKILAASYPGPSLVLV